MPTPAMLGYRVVFLPSWFPWKRSITIWWPLTRYPWIHLQAEYRKWWDVVYGIGLTQQEFDAWLIVQTAKAHEIRHPPQWRQFGRIGFLSRYLRREQRFWFEVECVAQEVRWFVQVLNFPVERAISMLSLDSVGEWMIPKSVADRARWADELWMAYHGV